MGLQGHAKETLEDSGFYSGYSFYTISSNKLRISNLRIRCDSVGVRNQIYKVLKKSREFCPKKVGAYVISFRPMSECGLPIMFPDKYKK